MSKNFTFVVPDNGVFNFSPLRILELDQNPKFPGTLAVNSNLSVKGTISSSNDANPASPTNTGVLLLSGTGIADVVLYDASQTANNREAEWMFFQGKLQARVKNDSGSAAKVPLAITAGYASGIKAIDSDSGSGAWSHTGDMSVSGVFTIKSSYTVANLPAPSAALKGARTAVTDGKFVSWGADVTGGDTQFSPVYCDGTKWVYG
ncbi:hypothetical protein BcepF1.012 [Burkholderia phage BcepF1]|uniref:Uncharacterized protein n=1 Tax=Burkholderia phage BcepF1 TaxID=2886897 RepID=A1YZR6_9CAUD|nr:hypothetical protein BcepF1.012 [Burkholderia phage BcepF1]ABL96743.1 hypothetical protein BcepF1.012 [Burkholderia phage BcepF1]